MSDVASAEELLVTGEKARDACCRARVHGDKCPLIPEQSTHDRALPPYSEPGEGSGEPGIHRLNVVLEGRDGFTEGQRQSQQDRRGSRGPP